MPRKPSERRSFKQEAMELNLTPMMNLIAILIPCLLISVAFVEIAVLKVAAPGDSQADAPAPDPDRVPLNLAVLVTENGYLLTTSARVFEDAGRAGLVIPVVERAVSCDRYLGTVPPPRARNRVAPCKDPQEERRFTVFDVPALRTRLLQLKDRFPDEHLVILSAQADLEFEALVDTMDATREAEVDGTVRPLFEEVVFRPAP